MRIYGARQTKRSALLFYGSWLVSFHVSFGQFRSFFFFILFISRHFVQKKGKENHFYFSNYFQLGVFIFRSQQCLYSLASPFIRRCLQCGTSVIWRFSPSRYSLHVRANSVRCARLYFVQNTRPPGRAQCRCNDWQLPAVRILFGCLSVILEHTFMCESVNCVNDIKQKEAPESAPF